MFYKVFVLIIIFAIIHEIDSLIYSHYQTSIVLYMPRVCLFHRGLSLSGVDVFVVLVLVFVPAFV